MRTIVLVSVALTTALTAYGNADDSAKTGDPIAELRRENAALSEKVARLERLADDQGRWLTDARAEEIRSLVGDVLADAATRSALQADAATAGWDRGFFIGSADGNFRLTVGGQIQFRFAYNRREISSNAVVPTGTNDREDNWGFENRRAKLRFAGHVFDPTLTYRVQMAFGRSSGANASNANAYLEESWIQKAFEGGWTVKGGQFKAPFLREELVSSRDQQLVERSLVNDAFSTNFVQGVQLGWESERFRLLGMYSDALRANRTSPVDDIALAGNTSGSLVTDFQTNPVDYAFTGRAEFLAAGSWRQFRRMSSPRGDEFGMLIGLAAYAQQLRSASAADDPSRMWAVTGDISFAFGGASLFAYGVYREVTLDGDVATRGGGSADTLDQWGMVVQAGYFILEDVELFARYEYGDLDTDRFRTEADAARTRFERDSIVTVGVNVFPLGVKRPEIKWTTDLGFAFDPVGDFATSGADWNADATVPGGSSESDQFVIRSQIQLLF